MRKKKKTATKQPTPNIKKLFDARTNTLIRATKKILKVTAGATEAIRELVGVDALEKSGAVLTWQDVSLVGNGKDGLVIFIGVISFKPGVEILVGPENKRIKITTENEPYFRRLFRAGIPLKLAHKSKRVILKYLKELEQNQKGIDSESTLDNPGAVEVEFDLSQLTDEQRKAYETNTVTTSRKIS